MALILIAVALYGSLLGERIPIRDGRGWDGNRYMKTAADLDAGWELVSTNPYLFQRMIPSLVVHAGLVVTGSARDDATILAAFMLLNTSLLLLTLWLWLAVANHFNLSAAARWLGFVGLFVNVPCFKIAYYYPAITDMAALALGMALVYFLLIGRTLGVALTALVGAFTWPMAGPMGALLVLFPREHEPRLEAIAAPISAAAKGLAVLTAVGVTLMSGYLFYARGIRSAGWGPVVGAVESVYPLSLLVTAVYVLVVIASLVPEPTPAGLLATLRRIRPTNLALALAIFMIPRLAAAIFTTGPELLTISSFIPYVFFLSTTRPGIFLVAHLVFFGPVLLLLPFVWKHVRALFQQWGAGAQLYTILGLMVAACPDSRQSMLIVPMLIVVLVWGCERARLASKSLVLLFGALAFVMSRVWLPFNIPSSAPPATPAEAGWDMSRYYETQGNYITEPHYLSGLALGGLILFLLSFVSPDKRAPRGTGAAEGAANSL